MIEVRLMGDQADCAAFVHILKKAEQRGEFEIRYISGWYANYRPPSKKEGRVYVEVE